MIRVISVGLTVVPSCCIDIFSLVFIPATSLSPFNRSVMTLTFLQISSLPLVFAVPREKEAEEVRNAIPGARVTVVSSPANLAALILLSAGVIAANTIALPIASYLRKPAFGMFESKMIAKKYSYPGVDVITEQDAGPAMLLVNATALRKRVDRLEELHPSA